MGKQRRNGLAKWIAAGAAVIVLVAGGVQQHTSAVARIGYLETSLCTQSTDIRDKLDELCREQVLQGKLLVRLATKLEVEP